MLQFLLCFFPQGTTRKCVVHGQLAPNESHVTAMICANAASVFAPTAWIMEGTHEENVFVGVGPDNVVVMSKKGFITDKIFVYWVGKFINYLHSTEHGQDQGFSLLITDDHKSRLNSDLI